jgi:prolyl oligopeptidase
MNDVNVPAWQPAKFAARLQAASKSSKPVLLDVDFEGGHGYISSKSKRIEQMADLFSFAFWQLGHPDFQVK